MFWKIYILVQVGDQDDGGQVEQPELWELQPGDGLVQKRCVVGRRTAGAIGGGRSGKIAA